MLNTIIFYLIVFHLLWVTFTLLVHRGYSHQYWRLHPILEHFCRFWLWVSYGMPFYGWLKYLVAQHRKHHRYSDTRYSDTEYDPISPHLYTIRQLLDYKHNTPGKQYYTSPEDVIRYSVGINNYGDWIERKIYLPYPKMGLVILWIIATILFGLPGFIIGGLYKFLIQNIIVVLAGYGLHKIGYTPNRPRTTEGDKSTNVFPLGILLAGEELHANHHDYAGKLNFADRWWEFDIGYWYAKFFMVVGLLKINHRS